MRVVDYSLRRFLSCDSRLSVAIVRVRSVLTVSLSLSDTRAYSFRGGTYSSILKFGGRALSASTAFWTNATTVGLLFFGVLIRGVRGGRRSSDGDTDDAGIVRIRMQLHIVCRI